MLIQEFGKPCYRNTVYFNFEEEDALKSIFESNRNPTRIIELLSIISGEEILPGDTLVLFDEVQECPEALTILLKSSYPFKGSLAEYFLLQHG